MIDDNDLVTRGMQVLAEQLGIIEAETFISIIKNDKFDYTKWREDKFEDLTLEELNAQAAEYASSHPFKGSATII